MIMTFLLIYTELFICRKKMTTYVSAIEFKKPKVDFFFWVSKQARDLKVVSPVSAAWKIKIQEQ